MIKNYYESVEIYHNPNWPYISDQPYRLLIAGGWGSGKTNALLGLIKLERPDVDRCYMSIRIEVLITYQPKRKSRD